MALNTKESATYYKYGSPSMDPESRIKLLKEVAGEVPIDPLEPAGNYAHLSTELFTRAKELSRKGPKEDAFILLARYLSIFETRFLSHPDYHSLSDQVRSEIKSHCYSVRKLITRMEKLLRDKFNEEYTPSYNQSYTKQFEEKGQRKGSRPLQSPTLVLLNTVPPSSRTDAEFQQLDRWLEHVFSEADEDGDGIIDEAGVRTLMLKLNRSCDNAEASSIFNEYKAEFGDQKKVGIGRREFASLFSGVTKYPMLRKVFDQCQSDGYITAEKLERFFKDQPEYSELQSASVMKLIEDYELPEVAKEGKLSLQGFANMILSPRFNALSVDHQRICQDMTRPLSHYFIASSHNTYLTGNQLTSDSSVEAYKSALLKSCRCVELDCWDGGDEEGPLVHHGGTLTSTIKFRNVLENGIKPYAFVTSPYPVILSLENHCGEVYQKRMAKHLNEVFGDAICRVNVDGMDRLPSPEQLKGKIIIKASKKLKLNLADGFRSAISISSHVLDEIDYDSDENVSGVTKGIIDSEISNIGSTKSKLGSVRPQPLALNVEELSEMVNICQAVKFKSFEDSKRVGRCYYMSSFVESKAKSLGDNYPLEFIRYNQRQLSRIYPMGMRALSSNLDPSIFWKFGCQIVALNYQTNDKVNLLNTFFFSENGNCGYVLKPSVLTDPNISFDPTKEAQRAVPVTFRLTILGALHLPYSGTGVPSSPWVQIKVIGFDYDNKVYETGEVKNNGLDPVWFATFDIQIYTPEYALLFFTVYDSAIGGSVFQKRKNGIAYAGVPVPAMALGYRHVNLFNISGELLTPAALFIHTEKIVAP